MSRTFGKSGQCLALALALTAFTGCESVRRGMGLRPTAEEVEEYDEAKADVDEVLDIKSPTRQPFFKNSRLSGAMSDQGREIERDLGIR